MVAECMIGISAENVSMAGTEARQRTEQKTRAGRQGYMKETDRLSRSRMTRENSDKCNCCVVCTKGAELKTGVRKPSKRLCDAVVTLS